MNVLIKIFDIISIKLILFFFFLIVINYYFEITFFEIINIDIQYSIKIKMNKII